MIPIAGLEVRRNIRGAVAMTLAIVASSPAMGADLAGATAFLRQVYGHYPQPANATPYDPLASETAATVFDPSMVALLSDDARLTPSDEVGAIDGDPICDCQDDAGLSVQAISVRADGPLRARASVILRFAEGPTVETHRVVFDLIQVGGSWRVHDIGEAGMPSLRALLVRSNAAAERGRAKDRGQAHRSPG